MNGHEGNPFGFLAHPAFSAIEPLVKERLSKLDHFPAPHELRGLAHGIACAEPPWFDFVPQITAQVAAAGGFDRFIAQQALVPTRSGSFHDLLGALVWLHFPALKRAVHRMQLARDVTGRGPVENAVTHFDESGVLVLSSRRALFDSLWHLQWERVFWDERALLPSTSRFIGFGHGLLDALREPHPRLMGKALFVQVRPQHLSLGGSELRGWLDRALAAQLASFLVEPACLHPLPVLGIPGWARAESPDYYRERGYFRVARQRERLARAPAVLDLESC